MKSRAIQTISEGLAEHDGSVEEFTLWLSHRLDDLVGMGYGWRTFDEVGRWTCHHQKQAQFNLRISTSHLWLLSWLFLDLLGWKLLFWSNRE